MRKELRLFFFLLHTYFSLSDLQMCAMSGTKGSSGFGSQSKEHMDKRTEKEMKTITILKAQANWALRIIVQLIKKKELKHTSTFRNCQSWRPLRPQDVQANASITVNVGMVDFRCKRYLLNPDGCQNAILRQHGKYTEVRCSVTTFGGLKGQSVGK